MNIAIIGATGMVGQKFLELLKEKSFPVQGLRFFVSAKNKGKTQVFKDQTLQLESLSDKTNLKNIDIAFFSAGEDISQKWAPRFAQAGAFVIDNSSAFRMEKHVPLIVPEVNGDQTAQGRILANPNCSTIQLVMVLGPLNKHFGLSAVHVSTYQAVSGAGKLALEQLKQESQVLLNQADSSQEKPRGAITPVSLPAHSKSITFNCIPQIGSINSAGFSTEEWKLMQETKKILNLPNLRVTATAVRVPAFNGHGEAVLLTLKQSINKRELVKILSAQKGLKILEGEDLPHQRFVDGQDDIYVGRIRPVPSVESDEQNGLGTQGLTEKPQQSQEWMMWITGDNLRKGAALNGLQIAKTLIDSKQKRVYLENTNSK